MAKITVPGWLFDMPELKHEEKWLYLCLLQKYEEVKEPGRSALAIPVEQFGREIAPRYIDPRSVVLEGLRLLMEAKVIYARRLNYPEDYPEFWMISFIKRDEGRIET